MPLYHYYISTSPGQPSPTDDGLSSIEASSVVEAIARLQRTGRLPAHGHSMWIHLLVWVDQEGQQRGFESIPLARFLPSNPPESNP